MTFSLVARDDTGAFGAVIASSSPAVAARCLNLRDAVGAANSQNITDPRLGTRILDAMAVTGSAQAAIDSVVASDSTAAYRQLVAVDAAGGTAVHSGAFTLGTFADAQGSGVVAAGNMLHNDSVPTMMVAAFLDAEGEIEERLLAALIAGFASGGEAGPIHSAGLAAVRGAGWWVTDLRVDWSETPVEDTAVLLERWLPERDNYVTRGIDPSTAPTYGVPGNE